MNTATVEAKKTPKLAVLRSRRFFGALLVLAALVAATALVLPFYYSTRETYPITSRVPKTHDMAQHLAVMEQFDKVLRAGSLYPRWLPDVNNGYGLAWTNYYPPGFYYLTSLINIAVNDWFYTMFAVSVLGLAASGLSFYIFSRLFYGRLASAGAALLYMAAPYHMLDLYWRAALPEFMGFILVPAIIYFAFKLGISGKARYFAGLGLFHGMYLLTHFPVAYLMTYILAFYAVILAATKRDWKIAFRIGVGIAIALVLGSIYWVPAALEAGYVTEPFTRMFPYQDSYITLLPRETAFADFVDLLNASFAVQTVTFIAAICVLYLFRDPRREIPEAERESEQARRMNTGLWIVMAVTTTFMATSFSIYISRLIPKLEAVSFPWRWLVLATFFTSVVVAAAIDRLTIPGRSSSRVSWGYRIVMTGAIAWIVWCTVHNVIVPTRSRPRLFVPPNYVESGFIPVGATQPQNMPAIPLASLYPSSDDVQVVRWEPLIREVRFTSVQPSILKLKTYNFPGWEARVDGQPAQISTDATGAQVINFNLPGEHRVELFFVNTPARTLGGALTGAAFLLIFGLFGADFVKKRRSSAAGTRQQTPDHSGASPAGRDAPGDDGTSVPPER